MTVTRLTSTLTDDTTTTRVHGDTLTDDTTTTHVHGDKTLAP